MAVKCKRLFHEHHLEEVKPKKHLFITTDFNLLINDLLGNDYGYEVLLTGFLDNRNSNLSFYT